MTAGVLLMSDLLKPLQALAPRINAASDDLSQSLASIEQQINDLSLGVEAWLIEDHQALSSEIVWPDNDRDSGYRFQHEQELGYGRHGDAWALLVRTVAYPQSSRQNNPQGWEYDGEPFELERKPLLRSSRSIRARAVDRLPALVNAIRDEASKVIEAVERARQVADSLK